MMHRAWSSIVEVPYCFSRSYVKFQGHTALKIVEFYPNWAFPDCNSSLNSPMAMKCCTKLETAKERCPIVFQGHPSNFKVTRDKTSLILTLIGRFRTIGWSQLSNPSDLPCLPLIPLGWRGIVVTVRAGGCQTCRTHISVTAWQIFSIQSSVEFSRPLVVRCYGHLPICPICVCPWAKNLSNLAQIGSRLCGTHISETAGWIYPI